ncbi:MAG TPA: hypothetical protein VMW83_15925 [Spirochaetia bacterium]|nr:hypothetical protein [Spirochaetia bacterium]
MAISCEVFAKEQDSGTEAGFVVAFDFVEKEIVTVCVRKAVSSDVGLGVGAEIAKCNRPKPVPGLLEVNQCVYQGIPASLTATGPVTISPTMANNRAGGSLGAELTPLRVQDRTVTPTATAENRRMWIGSTHGLLVANRGPAIRNIVFSS